MLAVSGAEVRRAAATMVVGGPVTATPLVSAVPPARHVRSGGAGPDMGAEAGFRRMGRDYGRAWTRAGPRPGPERERPAAITFLHVLPGKQGGDADGPGQEPSRGVRSTPS